MARLQSRQISQLHLYQVLHAMRLAREPMSRAEICETTRLSQPAVSSLTRRLLESGALVEVGARPSLGGGRRERELAINPEHLWVVGVKVSMAQFTITLTDFAGGVRRTAAVRFQAPIAQAALVRLLAREIEACLADADGSVRKRLSGVGVGLAGFVDSMAGEVLWTPIVARDERAGAGAQLAQALTDALAVPVFVENDANMLALSEQWFGHGGRLSNVAVVTLELGLGLGLIVNGELLRGHRGMAGELGHVKIEPGGRACRCGQRGCLEAYATKYAVVAQAQEAGLLPPGAMTSDAIEAGYARLAADAEGGNADAQALFDRQGRLLGLWVGNVVNLLSPQLVVVDTGAGFAAARYERVLREAAREAMALPERREVPLVIGHLDEAVWARGAAALVLQRLDESAEIVDAVTRHGFESESAGRRPDA